MTVTEALRNATHRLEATSDTARLDAELLMAHALGVSRSRMLLGSMHADVPEAFDMFVKRRVAFEPVAYITGVQEFYGREFAVSRDVLIPRPDSETLIETALEWAGKKTGLSILDLGTGSGALLVTLLAELPGSIGTGIEASAPAASVARHNARVFDANGWLPRDTIGREIGRHTILQRNWREEGWMDGLFRFDLVVSNPPYVEEGVKLDRDVADYEPESALFAGPEGLDDYRILFPQLRAMLRKDGIAIFEIGFAQAQAVTELAEKAGFAVELRHDLANRPRAVVLS